MAAAFAIVSLRIKDAVGVVKAYEEYVSYDTATATLATIAAAAAGVATNLDPVTDGQIVSLGIKLYQALPGGLKGAPVAGSDIEETGLFTFNTSAPGGKVYSIDVPAVAQAIL